MQVSVIGAGLGGLATTALAASDKLRLPAWLALPPGGGTVDAWLEPASPALRDLLLGLVRVSSYANAPAAMSAAAAFAQVRRALAGVLYLDGGWSSLVDALLPLAGPVTRGEVSTLPPGPVVIAGPASVLARSPGRVFFWSGTTSARTGCSPTACSAAPRTPPPTG